MDIIMQADKQLSSVSISKPEDTLSCSSVIDFLSGLSDTIQNLWWLFILIFTVLVLIVALFSIRRKANKFTNKQIDRLIKDGKYIPGIFVELNESKEVLRYFIYRKRWKKRLVQNFNLVYANAYGDILRKAYKNPNVRYKLSRRTSLKKLKKQRNRHLIYIITSIGLKWSSSRPIKNHKFFLKYCNILILIY